MTRAGRRAAVLPRGTFRGHSVAVLHSTQHNTPSALKENMNASRGVEEEGKGGAKGEGEWGIEKGLLNGGGGRERRGRGPLQRPILHTDRRNANKTLKKVNHPPLPGTVVVAVAEVQGGICSKLIHCYSGGPTQDNMMLTPPLHHSSLTPSVPPSTNLSSFNLHKTWRNGGGGGNK